MTAKKDLYNNISSQISIAPAAMTADTTGAGVDLRGYSGAMVQIVAGTWTDGVHTFEVQDSDDDSDYTAVSATYLNGTEPVIDAADEDAMIYEIGYTGEKRYLRVVNTVTGTPGTGLVASAVIVRGYPALMPTH